MEESSWPLEEEFKAGMAELAAALHAVRQDPNASGPVLLP